MDLHTRPLLGPLWLLVVLLVTAVMPSQEVEVRVVGNQQGGCSCNATDDALCTGINQYGKGFCMFPDDTRPDYPGLYAGVSGFQKWIDSNVATDRPGFVALASPSPDPVPDTDEDYVCPPLPPPRRPLEPRPARPPRRPFGFPPPRPPTILPRRPPPPTSRLPPSQPPVVFPPPVKPLPVEPWLSETFLGVRFCE